MMTFAFGSPRSGGAFALAQPESQSWAVSQSHLQEKRGNQMRPRWDEFPRVGPVLLGCTLGAIAYAASNDPLATILTGFAGVAFYHLYWLLEKMLDQLNEIRQTLHSRQRE